MSGRKFFVGGNWKANPTSKQVATDLITEFNAFKLTDPAEVVIAAPAPFLPLLKDTLRRDWAVSAENVYHKSAGAFTGEVTLPMLQSFGIGWTVLGHSERRDLIHESDDLLALKATAALDAGLKIIYCCGEHLEERQAEQAVPFVTQQIDWLIPAVPPAKWADVVIAYEPIWAIGTGEVASPQDAQDMCAAIRGIISAKATPEIAAATRILYGGSVKPDNAEELAAQPDIDGFLVGGASLTSGFIDIVKAAAAKQEPKEKT
jgi:triosephosphate isomerase